MNVGMIGCGKLGLPVALAIESRGHTVSGYDVNPAVESYFSKHSIPYIEERLQPLLDATKINIAQSIGELVASSDIIFAAVQTPHGKEFEGTTRLPDTRRDFDYRFLKQAVGEVAIQAEKQQKQTTLAVISTCLPGTFSREIKPLLNDWVDYVYTPQFIAMGTVLEDYLHPEFDLLGIESELAAQKLEEFYATINDAPIIKTDITTAEGIKVSYNTWITAKTVIANTWGEIAHRTGMNFDDIKKAWDASGKRLLSNRYMNAGVGDGGGCHPRDNIAMSWLSDQIGMSHNIFEDLMKAREDHMEFLAEECLKYGDYITVLGRSFKPETNIESGSPALLVANILRERGATVQHFEDMTEEDQVYLVDTTVLIATQHQRYNDYKYYPGTTIIDPFGFIEERDRVKVIHIGR